jgi:hypothetical protein
MHRPSPIPTTHPRRSTPDSPWAGRWLTALLGALALSLAIPTAVRAETAPAGSAPIETMPSKTAPTITTTTGTDPNSYECAGHIGAGKREAGSEEQQVEYEFLCNGQITGYQLQTQLPVTGIEGAPLVTNFQGQPTTDTFSCSGSFPGYAVNCVGTSTSGADERITGQFAIGWKLCTEPRVDPLLTVTYAYLNEKGVIAQAISGPFDLGRPLGCPATKASGKDRLSAYQGPEPTKKVRRHGRRVKGHGGEVEGHGGEVKGHGKGVGHLRRG